MNSVNSKALDGPTSSWQALFDRLGIPFDYGLDPWRPKYQEAESLIDAGLDIFERPQQLEPETLAAWHIMTHAAAQDGVILQIVSGFRSVECQAGLLERKLQQGQCIEDILKVNAAPGFSEHHTGCAIDLMAPDTEPLEETFESTSAFAWLAQHGLEFGFTMSYPRNNAQGFIYEPWHWRFHKK